MLKSMNYTQSDGNPDGFLDDEDLNNVSLVRTKVSHRSQLYLG